MSDFTVYDKTTGKILRSGNIPDAWHDAQATAPNEAVVSGRWAADDFWRDGDTFKPRAPLELSIDGTTISGLPAGSVLRCDDAVYGPIDDGTAEFDFQLPGKYVVRIDCVSHKAGSVTLTKE